MPYIAPFSHSTTVGLTGRNSAFDRIAAPCRERFCLLNYSLPGSHARYRRIQWFAVMFLILQNPEIKNQNNVCQVNEAYTDLLLIWNILTVRPLPHTPNNAFSNHFHNCLQMDVAIPHSYKEH
uniref:Uncharacterized protein n=1 Tax=Sphaerodactylus townsendi TaxID=933632 RepID=A0ACB8EFX3_9SAUR